MGIELPRVTDVETAVGHWRAADSRFATLLERYGDAPRALRHYGLVLWQDAQPANAVVAFTAAVALTPDDARLWGDLAGAFSATGRLPEAATCLEASLERDPTHADTWLRLGSICGSREDLAGAEAALNRALALDPDLTDAKLSLGLAYFHAKRFSDAITYLRDVLVARADNAPIQACYGQALSHCGDFAGAKAALDLARSLEPDNTQIGLKLAQMTLILDAIAGPLDDAMATCRANALVTADEFQAITRRSFHLLSAFGHKDAALKLGEARLLEAPDDPELVYLLPVLRGETVTRAPDAYVSAFFDKFADQFDHQLVDVLGYKAYEHLVTLLVEQGGGAARNVLDLGCGTGLSGPLLAAPGRSLVGVDLSPGMIEYARARGCYDRLIVAEAVDFLADTIAAYDLVFAADVLIYIGDLAPLMARVARALVPGGLLAFTIEIAPDAELTLHPTGRFAHGLAGVLDHGTRHGFEALAVREVDLRYETQGFVGGALIVLRKAAATP